MSIYYVFTFYILHSFIYLRSHNDKSHTNVILILVWIWNWGHFTSGYRHRSNAWSQVVDYFMKNDQHDNTRLLSLLTTLYVKVDFFQRLTFWPSLTLKKGQKEQHDFFKNWHTLSRDPKASSLRFSAKFHGEAYSIVIVRDPYNNNNIIL